MPVKASCQLPVTIQSLKGLYWSVESRVSAEPGPQCRNQEGGQRDVLEQIGALAHQQIHLVALLRGALVEGDAPQAGGTWQVPGMSLQNNEDINQEVSFLSQVAFLLYLIRKILLIF